MPKPFGSVFLLTPLESDLLVAKLFPRRRAFSTPEFATCLHEASEEAAWSLWSPRITPVLQVSRGEAGSRRTLAFGEGEAEQPVSGEEQGSWWWQHVCLSVSA